MTDLATLQTQLTTAEAVLEQVELGKKAGRVRVDGKEVEYVETSPDILLKRIARLRRAIAMAGGGGGPVISPYLSNRD